MNEEDDGATKGETCADQMTDSCQAHKDETAIRVT